MKRKRIVIKLGRSGDTKPPSSPPAGPANDKPEAIPSASEERRGIGRPLMIIGIVLVVLIAGAIGGVYFWWRNYQATPAYSLAILADAAQRNDTAAIDNLFDTDKITDDFVAQVRERTSASPVNSLFGSSVPTITPKMRQVAHDELIKELQRLTVPAKGKPFVLVALAVTSFADIKQENNTAHAKVNIIDEQLELTMQREAERWRIIAVQDDKLTKRVADAVMRNTSPGDQIQDQILKQLDRFKNNNSNK